MQSSIGFRIVPNNAERALAMTVRLDGEVILQLNTVTETVEFTKSISDDAGKHTLEFELSNKLPEHTTVDDQGNIVSDSTITVENISMDGVVIDTAVQKLAQYWHDRNGTTAKHMDRFYGVMGCNGVAHFEFTTPTYQWLLDNL
jgi:hypothetical protein